MAPWGRNCKFPSPREFPASNTLSPLDRRTVQVVVKLWMQGAGGGDLTGNKIVSPAGLSRSADISYVIYYQNDAVAKACTKSKKQLTLSVNFYRIFYLYVFVTLMLLHPVLQSYCTRRAHQHQQATKGACSFLHDVAVRPLTTQRSVVPSDARVDGTLEQRSSFERMFGLFMFSGLLDFINKEGGFGVNLNRFRPILATENIEYYRRKTECHSLRNTCFDVRTRRTY